MIAYNRTTLTNLKINQHTQKWRRSNMISEEQAKSIYENHPVDFYTPNHFIRIILFFAAVIAINASLGFVALILDVDSATVGSFLCIITGIFLYVILEKVIIAERKYYQAGIDDAFLYVSLGFILAGMFIFLDAIDANIQTPMYFLLSLPFLVYTVIRFADKLLALAAISCFFGFIFYQLVELGTLAKAILPFVG